MLISYGGGEVVGRSDVLGNPLPQSVIELPLDEPERLTGRPVHGVLPWLRDLWLDSEDSLALRDRATSAPDADGVTDRLRVAVVVLPRISNFTDVDALCLEPGLDVVFADTPRALTSADVVVPTPRPATSAPG